MFELSAQWCSVLSSECSVLSGARPWEACKAVAFLESLHIPLVLSLLPTEDLAHLQPTSSICPSADTPITRSRLLPLQSLNKCNPSPPPSPLASAPSTKLFHGSKRSSGCHLWKPLANLKTVLHWQSVQPGLGW